MVPDLNFSLWGCLRFEASTAAEGSPSQVTFFIVPCFSCSPEPLDGAFKTPILAILVAVRTKALLYSIDCSFCVLNVRKHFPEDFASAILALIKADFSASAR